MQQTSSAHRRYVARSGPQQTALSASRRWCAYGHARSQAASFGHARSARRQPPAANAGRGSLIPIHRRCLAEFSLAVGSWVGYRSASQDVCKLGRTGSVAPTVPLTYFTSLKNRVIASMCVIAFACLHLSGSVHGRSTTKSSPSAVYSQSTVRAPPLGRRPSAG